jgi:hypothetical protein
MTSNITTPIVIYLLSGALYAFIGMNLSRKTFADASDAAAWRAFRIWWYAMAANTAINAVAILVLAAGVTSLPLFVGFSVTATLAASYALWGLLTYLIYVYTGNKARWLTYFYIAFALFLFYSIYSFQPSGVAMGAWQTSIQYANAPTGAFAFAYAVFFLLLIALPPVIGSIGMFTLYFRVQERSAKYRALLVPLGIFALFGLAYLVPLALYPFGLRTGDLPWWPLTIRIVGLAALVVIYWAYFPPSFIQKRFKVSTVLG